MKADDLKSALTAQLNIPEAPSFGINHHLLFLGSCFAENIGTKMAHLGFDTLVNPFGIIYNPVSLTNMVERIVQKHTYSTQDLFFFNGIFHSLEHHGTFADKSAENLVDKIQQRIEKAEDFLKKTDTVMVTLGTAFAHVLEQKNAIVANCHKLPSREFLKRLLTENEIDESLEKMVHFFKKSNPNIEIVFTISPVKHLREGILENSLSKARLLSALFRFIDRTNDPKMGYFPAFEIVTEELRDYRYYEPDLAHPSQWTILYIFRKFLECKLTPRAKEYIELAVKFARMNAHKPMSIDPEEINKWEKSKADFWGKLKLEFPDKNWETVTFEPL